MQRKQTVIYWKPWIRLERWLLSMDFKDFQNDNISLGSRSRCVYTIRISETLLLDLTTTNNMCILLHIVIENNRIAASTHHKIHFHFFRFVFVGKVLLFVIFLFSSRFISPFLILGSSFVCSPVQCLYIFPVFCLNRDEQGNSKNSKPRIWKTSR